MAAETAFPAPRGITLDAAQARFAGHDVGSLQPGKRADFVVLDGDSMAVAPERLCTPGVLAT